MKSKLFISFLFTLSLSNIATAGDTKKGVKHLASGAVALGVATGKMYGMSAISGQVGKKVTSMAKAAPPWARTVLYGIAFTEFNSAYQSFKNGRRVNNLGNNFSSTGIGMDCQNGVCTDGSADATTASSDLDAIFQSDDTFNQFTDEVHLTETYGRIPNPVTEMKKLEAMGYGMNEDGSISTPDGKTLTPDDLAAGLAEGGAAAGSAGAIDNEVKKLTAKNKKYIASIQRYRARGAGGFANKARGVKSNNRANFKGYNFGTTSNARKPASAHGAITYVKGDPIGASGDNVFHIIERAYDDMVTKKSLKQPDAKK